MDAYKDRARKLVRAGENRKLNTENKEKYNELMHDIMSRKEFLYMYFASLISESCSREECVEKLTQLEMMKDYLLQNGNIEDDWLRRIDSAKAIILRDLDVF